MIPVRNIRIYPVPVGAVPTIQLFSFNDCTRVIISGIYSFIAFLRNSFTYFQSGLEVCSCFQSAVLRLIFFSKHASSMRNAFNPLRYIEDLKAHYHIKYLRPLPISQNSPLQVMLESIISAQQRWLTARISCYRYETNEGYFPVRRSRLVLPSDNSFARPYARCPIVLTVA